LLLSPLGLLVNILPVTLPAEMFISSTPHSAKKAAAILLSGDEPPQFDWVIKGETFWSFLAHAARARWRDCPPEYGPYTTIYNRFNRWSRQGICSTCSKL
jgi:transposase